MTIVTAGIKGLDEMLDGGFIRHSIVLVAGTAGTGKTTFAMQSLFNAAREEVCLFMPVVSESVAMLNVFMSGFGFYDPSLCEAKKIHFFNLSDVIRERRPDEIIAAIEERIESINPQRIAIDPVTALSRSIDQSNLRRFWYDLFATMKGWDALVILTGEFTREELAGSMLGYMVDAIIMLDTKLEVVKMRGKTHLHGRHAFEITSDGITVFPRIRYEPSTEIVERKMKTGIAGLDAMLDRGVYEGSVTLISGGSGTGKTIIGLQFITEGALAGEHGLIISFEDTPSEIKRTAKGIGIDLEELERRNLVRIVYGQVVDLNPDRFALCIRDEISSIGAERVMFDSITSLEDAFLSEREYREYIRHLLGYFKSEGVTTICTSEVPRIMGELQVTTIGISSAIDTIIFLQYVEIRSAIRKVISVIKSSASDHDKEIREFTIGDRGVEIKVPFKQFERVMGGRPTIVSRFAEALE